MKKTAFHSDFLGGDFHFFLHRILLRAHISILFSKIPLHVHLVVEIVSRFDELYMNWLMRLALDTNILAYAEGIGDETRWLSVGKLVKKLTDREVILPTQNLGELSCVLVAKHKRNNSQVRETVFEWTDSFLVADPTWFAFQTAYDLTIDHQLSIWMLLYCQLQQNITAGCFSQKIFRMDLLGKVLLSSILLTLHFHHF